MGRVLQVGDQCVGQKFTVDVEFNGRECTIVAPLQTRDTHHGDGVVIRCLCYGVEWAQGGVECIAPANLKPKYPREEDPDTVVSWASLDWRPEKARSAT